MTWSTPEFSTDYQTIIKGIERIDALPYGRTRNFLNGGVTYLSPYISRGVLSLPYLKEKILSKHSFKSVYKLIQELAWREYFQRVWEARPDLVQQDAKNVATQTYEDVPVKIMMAETGIEVIDNGIKHLYEKGYMHNHLRMYTAMLTCNIAKTKWQQPAAWLYYYLLDGDIASNQLNWQWIAGTFSSKNYIANQENINRYSQTSQSGTFLDHEYRDLAGITIPAIFDERKQVSLYTVFPETKTITLDLQKPLCIYNSYQLDPLWQQDKDANRILLLEPEHFKNYPVSERVLDFILDLSKNINGLQVFIGSFDELSNLYGKNTQDIYFKRHPLSVHYKGTALPNEWMFPEVSGFFPSFSSYWKKCQKYL